MMQLLKSILLGEQAAAQTTEIMKTETLESALNDAHVKIALLEEKLITANESIADLSMCVKNIALATASLSQEMAIIITSLKQMAAPASTKNDLFTWNKDDDDEYLN